MEVFSSVVQRSLSLSLRGPRIAHPNLTFGKANMVFSSSSQSRARRPSIIRPSIQTAARFYDPAARGPAETFGERVRGRYEEKGGGVGGGL